MRKLIRTSSAMRFAGGINAWRCIVQLLGSAVVSSFVQSRSVTKRCIDSCTEPHGSLRSVWAWEKERAIALLSLPLLSGFSG